MNLKSSPGRDFNQADPSGPLRHQRSDDAGALADGRRRVAYVPLMWAIEEINRGELEILLPSYQSDPRPVYALYTEKDKLPLKVQVCINYLTEYFVGVAKIYQGCTAGGLRQREPAMREKQIIGPGIGNNLRTLRRLPIRTSPERSNLLLSINNSDCAARFRSSDL
jgi:hypothetical protein